MQNFSESTESYIGQGVKVHNNFNSREWYAYKISIEYYNIGFLKNSV